jgi:hypothetical protein
MTGETKAWIGIAIEALVCFGSMAGIIWYFRRKRRQMSDHIYYHCTLPAGKRTMTIYPEKLTEEQRKKLAAIEARLLEFAETASEEMAISLKENK